ncbi:MAG: acyl carrier protein [Clostridiales bacterium]|jgi:acyl carrier protein|nr:acyl carrier protein [Clostridiales bacterium]
MARVIDVLQSVKPAVNFNDKNVKDLYGQGLLDSVDVILIVSELEDVFGIEIGRLGFTREDFNNLTSIENLVKRHDGVVE